VGLPRRQLMEWEGIRGARPPTVEADHPGEGGEPQVEARGIRILPLEVEVAEAAWSENEIDGALADRLVGDPIPPEQGILRFWLHRLQSLVVTESANPPRRNPLHRGRCLMVSGNSPYASAWEENGSWSSPAVSGCPCGHGASA